MLLLARKFLSKSLSHSSRAIFNIYYSLFVTRRYVPKSMPILSIIAKSFSDFYQSIMNSLKLLLDPSLSNSIGCAWIILYY